MMILSVSVLSSGASQHTKDLMTLMQHGTAIASLEEPEQLNEELSLTQRAPEAIALSVDQK